MNAYQTVGFTYISYMNEILKTRVWGTRGLRMSQENGTIPKFTHFGTWHISQTISFNKYRHFSQKFQITEN